MPKPKTSAETPKRGTPSRLAPRDGRDTTSAPLADEELDRVSGGYIGETEKNLRRD